MKEIGRFEQVVAPVGKQSREQEKISPSVKSVSVLPAFQPERAGHSFLVIPNRKPKLATVSIAHVCVHPSSFTGFPAGFSFPARASCRCGECWSATQKADILCQLGHVDSVGGEVPEHLNQLIWEGVEVDVELAVVDVVLGVCVVRLVVVHHLHDLQQVFLAQLR